MRNQETTSGTVVCTLRAVDFLYLLTSTGVGEEKLPPLHNVSERALFQSLLIVGFRKKKHLNGAVRLKGRSEADKSEGRGWSIDSGNYLVPSAWFSLRVADRAFRARRRPW